MESKQLCIVKECRNEAIGDGYGHPILHFNEDDLVCAEHRETHTVLIDYRAVRKLNV